jgi:hypothetical protein
MIPTVFKFAPGAEAGSGTQDATLHSEPRASLPGNRLFPKCGKINISRTRSFLKGVVASNKLHNA